MNRRLEFECNFVSSLKVWTEHESVAICRKQQIEPVDLDHCLRAFTSEEKLEEGYYCGHCKCKMPATKKLQIWKLPPILIVHLKRFNFVNNKWVKSQKVVNFPYKNFDPTPYLASVPQETILRHKELKEHGCMKTTVNASTETSEDSSEHTIGGCIKEDDENNEKESTKETLNEKKTEPETSTRSIPSSKRVLNEDTLTRRKRLVSTSLTKSPVIDGAFIDFHQHNLNDGEDPYDLKYKLYAVVVSKLRPTFLKKPTNLKQFFVSFLQSHSGMLNGGHYISYASNPNNSWYCYNDSSCREIQQQPNVDPGSAYLLFYERQGLNYSPYLPKVDGKSMPNLSALEVDEADSELRKMCVIS